MLPIWIYIIVALAIAVVAFGIGQVAPGLGMPFVALATTIWTAYSVTLSRRRHRR